MLFFKKEYNKLRGGWCWFQDPRAVRFLGKHDRTYFGWTNDGKIIISYYDHMLKIGGMPQVVSNVWHADDHCAPSILILPDGHILVFWSAHYKDYIYVRKSSIPEEIAGWEKKQIISRPDNNCCYTNSVYLSQKRIYLFYRHNPDLNIKCIYSDDNALTWSDPETVMDFHNGKYNEAYIKIEARGNTIHLAASACRHGNFSTYEHIYYAYFNDAGWRKHDGSILKLPLTPNTMESAFNSGPDNSWIWDIALDKNSYPTIVFSHKVNTGNHEYWSLRWDGLKWIACKICDSGHAFLYREEPLYSGGVYLNHENPSLAYTAVWDKNSYEIKKFEFNNGSWNKIKDITKNSHHWNIRPVSPRNAREDLEVIWMSGSYNSYEDFNTSINYSLKSK